MVVGDGGGGVKTELFAINPLQFQWLSIQKNRNISMEQNWEKWKFFLETEELNLMDPESSRLNGRNWD